MNTKTMIAIAALCGAVAFQAKADGVVSSDVVGYDSIGLRSGAKGVGGAFVSVSGAELTLGDLAAIGYDAAEGYADFQIQAKQLDPYGRGGTTYYWADFEEEGDTYKGWYDEDMNPYNDLSLLPGEGLWVYAPNSSFQLQSAGAVSKTSIAVTLRSGAKMVSNPMPTTLQLGEITVAGYNTEDGYADFQIQAKKLDAFGRGDTTYYWADFDEEGDTYYGWFDEDMNDYNDVEVAAGEGLWIYSPSTAFSVVFPSPLVTE